MDKLISVIADGELNGGKDKINVEYYGNSDRVTFTVIEDIGNVFPYYKSVKLKSKHLESFIKKIVKTTEAFREKQADGMTNISTPELFVKKNKNSSLSVWSSGNEIGFAVNPRNATCAVMFMTVERAESFTLELIEIAELLEGGN